MNANVGSVDRAVRNGAGLVLPSLIFLLNGSGRWFGLIGLVPLLSALFRFCPLNTVLSINNCPAEQKRP